MVTLYNVIDTRTGKFHSEVRVKQRMVRFFVKENFEPGGTLEERVAVLEEVLQEQVMEVREEEKGGD